MFTFVGVKHKAAGATPADASSLAYNKLGESRPAQTYDLAAGPHACVLDSYDLDHTHAFLWSGRCRTALLNSYASWKPDAPSCLPPSVPGDGLCDVCSRDQGRIAAEPRKLVAQGPTSTATAPVSSGTTRSR